MNLHLARSPALHARPTDTEIAAAENVRPHVKKLRQKVFTFIVQRGDWGATGWEIYSRTGIWIYTVKPRLTELKKLDLIVDNAQRRTNGNGQDEIVYVLTRTGSVLAQNMGLL